MAYIHRQSHQKELKHTRARTGKSQKPHLHVILCSADHPKVEFRVACGVIESADFEDSTDSCDVSGFELRMTSQALNSG